MSRTFYTVGMSLEDVEHTVVAYAFEYFQKNKTATASSLGISVRTLESKLEKYVEEKKSEKERLAYAKQRREETLKRHRFGTNQDPTLSKATDTNPLRGQSSFEPAPQIPAQSPVPMQERPEVQEMLPQKAARGRPRKISEAVL